MTSFIRVTGNSKPSCLTPIKNLQFLEKGEPKIFVMPFIVVIAILIMLFARLNNDKHKPKGKPVNRAKIVCFLEKLNKPFTTFFVENDKPN